MARHIQKILFGAAAFSLLAGGAAAQSFPERPVRLVVPFAAGGSTDVISRIVASEMNARLGQPVVVENKAGAGGSTGSAEVARAAPDGYTLLAATVSTHAINPALFAKLPFDAAADFTPVIHLVDVPNVLLVANNVPAKTVAEFRAYAAANPGRLNYATPGVGSVGHLQSQWFANLLGVQMTHVPYRGAGPALQDLMAGQVQVMVDNVPTALEQIRAGTVRALVVTSAARIPQLPDTQSSVDAGLPDFIGYSWLAWLAPKGTPAPVAERLRAAAADALASASVRERLTALSASIVAAGPEKTAAFMQAERAKWAPVVAATGVKLD